jgi:hypothetical protein
MSVGSDDSGSSDLTSYYCLDCDTRHKLGSDALPSICGIKYSSGEESIGNIGSVTHVPAVHLARYQISAIDPVTGAEIPPDGNTGHDDNNRPRRDAKASGSNTGTTVTVSQEE